MPTLVQSAFNEAVGSSTNVKAFTSNVVANNLLVVGIVVGNGQTVSSITDSQNNSYTQAGVYETDPQLSIYYAVASSSAANTVTATLTGTPTSQMWIYEVNGHAGTNTASVTATGSTTSISTANVSFSSAVLFAVFRSAAANGFTAGTGFTLSSNSNGGTGMESAMAGITSPTTFPADEVAPASTWTELGVAIGTIGGGAFSESGSKRQYRRGNFKR